MIMIPTPHTFYHHFSPPRRTDTVKIDLDDLLDKIKKRIEEKEERERKSEEYRQEEERRVHAMMEKMGISDTQEDIEAFLRQEELLDKKEKTSINW